MPSPHRLRESRGKQEEPDEKSGEDGGRGIANFGKLDSREAPPERSLNSCIHTQRVVARGTPIRSDTATRHRVSPETGPVDRVASVEIDITAVDFGTRLVNENRSRIIWVRGHQPHRSPNLNAGHIDAIGSVDRDRTAGSAPADNASVIREVGRGRADDSP
ncbi:hypothetical protein G5I_10797 [Acromyrmex echinatior]|uniref:Uncharacterized protein n=1 Tax=Acromyrmex echinatior TaxID=103372 RepID=F4WXV4_ACREC|nr:hypothetical protein G5I_10797 [Acromyrmex echinatior]